MIDERPKHKTVRKDPRQGKISNEIELSFVVEYRILKILVYNGSVFVMFRLSPRATPTTLIKTHYENYNHPRRSPQS